MYTILVCVCTTCMYTWREWMYTMLVYVYTCVHNVHVHTCACEVNVEVENCIFFGYWETQT